MGQVPQIEFKENFVEISCYARKIRISKTTDGDAVIQLLSFNEALGEYIHKGFWQFKNDPDFDIFWECISDNQS
jgi:hypothetical protein